MDFIVGLMLFDIVFVQMFDCIMLLNVMEIVLLLQVFLCVIVYDIVFLLDVFGFDNVVMDGYVVWLNDFCDGVVLLVVGKVFVGQLFNDVWLLGICICIMIGVLVLEGCDVLVMQEEIEQIEVGVCFIVLVKVGQYICCCGEDIV